LSASALSRIAAMSVVRTNTSILDLIPNILPPVFAIRFDPLIGFHDFYLIELKQALRALVVKRNNVDPHRAQSAMCHVENYRKSFENNAFYIMKFPPAIE
jgi:hypothetical protein